MPRSSAGQIAPAQSVARDAQGHIYGKIPEFARPHQVQAESLTWTLLKFEGEAMQFAVMLRVRR